MNIEDDAMTPEERALERELAQRLARLGPQTEPSPALDARILAAAHAALHARAPRRRRKPATWPAVFGIAASLAFALGVAGKLRPLPEPVVATQESASPIEDPLADYAPPPPAQVYTPRPRRVLEVPAPPPAQEPARTRDLGSAKPRVPRRATPAEEPPFAFEAAPAPATAPVPSAPSAGFAPPPPPPAPAATGNAADMVQSAVPAAQRREAIDANASRATQELSAQQARKAAAPAVAPAPAQEIESAEPDEDVVPPMTADSPQVRQAWLQRIRELARAGHVEDARASLREFRHRYPGATLPDDLRALDE